ncbi:MAG: hypothetical protein GX540_08825 [Clostridiales bacterium]|nr:hypothetical protein [Clostridiales bacterium]
MDGKNILKKIGIGIFIFFNFIGVSFAAPNITSTSGNLSKGQNVYISGSSFGTHPDYHKNVSGKLNWLWQNFEQDLKYDGLNTSYDSFWKRQTNNGRSGYWASRTGQGNIQGLISQNVSFNTGQLFLSYWCLLPSNVDNGKTVRIRLNNQSVDYWYNLRGGNLASDSPSQFVLWGALGSLPKDKWFRIDMLLSNNPISQKFWVIGSNGNNPVYSGTQSSIISNASVELNLGAGYDSSNGYYGFDDVFGNFTQARVEICNASTWGSRSQCDIQIPTTWSSNSIGITVNQGAFGSGSQAYLYVVDSNGAVNTNGYPVTIGASSDSGTPTTPPTGTAPPAPALNPPVVK